MRTDDSIFELLRREHADLERRHAELIEGSPGPDDVEALRGGAATLLRDLRTHELVETRALATLLTARAPDSVVVERLERGHAELERIQQRLAASSEALDWLERFRELGVVMKAHFQFEEDAVFPATRYLFSRFTEARMKRRYTRLRREMPWSRGVTH